MKDTSQPAVLDIALSDFNEEEIKAEIKNGFHAQVEYKIRVYRDLIGLAQLLGDELLLEEHPTFSGSWDVFSKSYEIRYGNGNRKYCSSWEDFYQNFFHLKDFTFTVSRKTTDPLYILVQVRLQRIILTPPINILTVFRDPNSQSSAWKRLELSK